MSVCMFIVVPAYAQELNFGINDRVFVDEQTLVISGKTSPGNEIAIRLHGTDETIKVFEQITVNESGSFGYDFAWPKDSVDYPYGIYTLEIIDLSQNTAYESVEIEFTPKKLEQDIRNKFVKPPLKQFKDVVPFHEIECKSYLQKIIKHDSTPVCVKPETIPKLIERGWTGNITKAGQSGKISSNLEDATSSYMNRIIPTLDDFKNVLSEPYNMDTIFSKFGEPHDDIGSGIHIYVYGLNDFTEIWVGYVDDIWYVKHVDANGNLLEDLFVKNPEPLTPLEDDFDIPEVKLFLEKYPQSEIIVDQTEYEIHKKHYMYTDSHTGDSVNLVLMKNITTGDMNNALNCPSNQNHSKYYEVRGSENITEYLQDYDCLSDSDIGKFEPIHIRESFLDLDFGKDMITVFTTDRTNLSSVSMDLSITSQVWTTIPIQSLIGAHDRLPETHSDDRRGPGTVVSDTEKAGTYITQNDNKEFWYTIGGSQDQIITIELQDHEFDRITFVSDKNQEWIEQINKMADSINVHAFIQTTSTHKGTLDVSLMISEIDLGKETILQIDFTDPQTQEIQTNVDYTMFISKDGKTIFGPIPSAHTITGSVEIPFVFSYGEGTYSVNLEVERILYQPISTETATFDVSIPR